MDQAQLIAAGLGTIVGAVLALTGAGGAILSVPLLGFTLSLTVVQAGPIGLLAVSLSAGLGAILGLRAKILRYRAALFMALFGIILSPFGLITARYLPDRPLSLIFACVLIYVAYRMIIQARHELQGTAVTEKTSPPCVLNQSIGRLIWTKPCARALALAGAMAGFFSGLLGVGGGFIIVPSLKKFTDLPVKAIVATSLGVLTIVSSVNVVIATISGTMIWPIAIPFAAGALLGLLAGRQFANKLSGPLLQQCFAVFAATVALAMIVKAML